MKSRYLTPLLLVALLLAALPARAHDFEVDGIYYNILDADAKTVEVTRGTVSNPGFSIGNIPNYSVINYTGDILIPEIVTYSDASYSVTSIGESAFGGCSELTSVTIPNSVTSIEDAFDGCNGLTIYINDLEAWCNIDFSENSSNPLSYASNLYLNNQLVTNLVIPNTITTIKDFAFYGFSGITSVEIPSNVTYIGEDAFSGCTGLTSVNFNATNCSIAYRIMINGIPRDFLPPFKNCTNLTEVTVGENVTTIPSYLFSDCSRLTSVNFNATNCSVSEATTPFQNCTNITTITIGENVTTIPGHLFRECLGLTSIEIPISVTSIGDNAFYGCSGLTEVHITDIEAWCKIDFATNEANPLFYANNLYLNGELVTNLVIPNTITEIKNYAFYNCAGLTEVTIPNSVTSIGNHAFSDCTGLTSIEIPSSVTSIGKYAFWYCTGLTIVNYNATNCSVSGTYIPFSDCTNLTEVIVGESVDVIPNYLFYGCSGLTSLEIPSSVKSIGMKAFWGCNKLVTQEIISRGQTTVTVSLNTPTKYTPAMRNAQGRGKVTVTGLTPGTTNTCYVYLIINEHLSCYIREAELETRSFNVSISGSTGPTTLNAIGSHNADDMTTITKQGINIGSTIEYDGNNSIKSTGLDPNTNYTIYYGVYVNKYDYFSTNKTFKTAALTWESGEYQATSTSSVRLLTETNCDATEGTGIEWRRYGAPENMKPNSVACPVVDGMLVGTLRGLNPDVYYEYRPYYTSVAGNTYYGEWTAFFSGDAYVHFDPEVRTYADMQVYKNNATIKGYALEGSDAISAQGFEYWKSSNQPIAASTAEVKTIAASGIAMTATIADLEYNTTYCYRAFVTTATGTYYGDTMEFTTEVISGIETIDVDATELTVSLRENPATATAWVRAAGAAATDCQYYIVSMNGATVDNGIIPADGDWQPIELNCPSGVYILMVTDGTARRTLRLIAR